MSDGMIFFCVVIADLAICFLYETGMSRYRNSNGKRTFMRNSIIYGPCDFLVVGAALMAFWMVTDIDSYTASDRISVFLCIVLPFVLFRRLLTFRQFDYKDGTLYSHRFIGPRRKADMHDVSYEEIKFRDIRLYRNADGQRHFFGRLDGATFDDYEDLLAMINSCKSEAELNEELNPPIPDEFKVRISAGDMVGVIVLAVFGACVAVFGTLILLSGCHDGDFKTAGQFVVWLIMVEGTAAACLLYGLKRLIFCVDVRNGVLTVRRLFHSRLVIPANEISSAEVIYTPAHSGGRGSTVPASYSMKIYYGGNKKIGIEENSCMNFRLLERYLSGRTKVTHS